MKADPSRSVVGRDAFREPTERTAGVSHTGAGRGNHGPDPGPDPARRGRSQQPSPRSAAPQYGNRRYGSGQRRTAELPPPDRHHRRRDQALLNASLQVPGPRRHEDEAATAILDLGLRDRQAAGLAALLSLATSIPTREERVSRSGDRPDSAAARPPADAQPQSRLATIKARVARDHMLRNSLYLMLNSALQAGFGFTFWIITARLFNTADVGRASSLLSATTVIAYLSLLGLNTTFGRYLATTRDRDTLITAGLLVVAVCGTMIGLIYTLLTPLIAPRIDFVEKHPAMMAGFVLLTATAAVNLLTDSIFVASRRADLTALVDGGIGGIGKVVAAFLLVGTGAWGVYSASATGILLSAVASLVLIVIVLRSRPSFRQPLRTLRPWLGFSGANYLGNLLYLAPTLVVPLIVLDRLGSSAAGYYFIAFQVASILFSAALAVEQTFLAEGSRQDTSMRQLRRRSGRTLALLCIPPCAFMIFAGRWLLLAFGSRYYHHAGTSLTVLALAAGPVALNNWALTLLRLAGKLGAIVVSTAVYAVSICGLAWIGAAHGITGVAVAWPIGALLGAAVARATAPKNTRPRHRRTRAGQANAEFTTASSGELVT